MGVHAEAVLAPGGFPGGFSAAESGALALDEAAAGLDRARTVEAFLQALERNLEVWRALTDAARQGNWGVPSRNQAEFALATSGRGADGVNDDAIHALIDINRHVSAQLAPDGDVDRLRLRAQNAWSQSGRPRGQDLGRWLLDELRGARREGC